MFMNVETKENAKTSINEFDVTITETLQKVVTVEANNQEEAEQIVSDKWYDSEYILYADNFTGVEFKATPTGRELTLDNERSAEDEETGKTTNEKTKPIGEKNKPTDEKDKITNAPNETTVNDGENPINEREEHKMNVVNAPLAQNEYVKQLLTILHDNEKDTSGLTALLNHVSEMENFVKRAEEKIADMKSQLTEMKEIQKHPIKNTLQNTIKVLENKIAEVKGQRNELKRNITDGCKAAVSAFKEKGISALESIASFFHLKSGLQNLKQNINGAIQANNKTIAKIETFSSEYHSANRAIKNMARMVIGKEPVSIKKEAGKLAKTITTPYKAQKSALTGLSKTIDKTIAKLEQLEDRTPVKQAERKITKKPSLIGTLQKNLAIVEKMKREQPVQERVKLKEAEV